MKKKNGFTLIELLAVIIILGILMIIAIPSVTRYISDSRKNSYVDSAKEIIGSARNLVNSGELEMYDTDATYYIDVNCIKTENAMKSPYGEFVDMGAFVVVTYDGKGYDYFWTSVDDAGQGIKGIVKYDKLEADNIESDLTANDISTLRTLDGRGKVILITERNSCKKEGEITENLIPVNSEAGEEGGSSGGGSSSNAVVYPTGKTKDTVVTGDLVTIGTEEFFVVKHDGNDLILLSHFNLKVGNIYNYTGGKTGEYTNSDYGYGRQSSETTGSTFLGDSSYYRGTMKFSNTYYWNEKVGTDYPGSYCNSNTYTTGTNCAYVYDSNSNLKTYVDNYKIYLEEQGATIKSARLLRVEEAFELGCGKGQWSCKDSPANAPSWVYETSYWLGSAYDTTSIWNIGRRGVFNYGHETYGYYYGLGIRPVIVI